MEPRRAGLDILQAIGYAVYMIVTLVTKFERLRGVLEDGASLDEQGLMLNLTSDTTQFTKGTILFFPWHMIEYVVISRPENSVSEDDLKADDTSQIMTRSGAV